MPGSTIFVIAAEVAANHLIKIQELTYNEYRAELAAGFRFI